MSMQKKTAEKVPDEKMGAVATIPKPSQVLSNWQEFEGALIERENEIAAMLPQHVSKGRFISSAIAAVKQNPDLLRASPRSLMSAVTKSAQDGLIPDGREGVITAYAGEAKWNPMTYGLRKRAKEIDGILIDAQVVRANDHFIWHQGDVPRIEHIPAALGTARGNLMGVYAIFKREDGTVLHREVMDEFQVAAVKEQSKAKGGLLWTTFEEEAWRKTVVRRGIKSVPVSEKLEAIAQRDDDHFDFGTSTPAIEENGGQMIPPRPKESDFARKPEPKPVVEATATEKKPEPTQQAAQGPDGRPEPPPVGEEVQRLPEPSQTTQEPPRERSEPVPEAQDEEDRPLPSDAYMGAVDWLDTLEAGLPYEKDLDDMKKRGRGVIDAFEGLTDDERDMARGRFTTLILTEQQRRAKRKR